jgi:hypothetical protein
MTLTKPHVRAYYDTDSDPHSPGYGMAWDTLGQATLTAPLDASTPEAAMIEAAALLDVEGADVSWED